jgi:hypothetical protein
VDHRAGAGLPTPGGLLMVISLPGDPTMSLPIFQTMRGLSR